MQNAINNFNPYLFIHCLQIGFFLVMLGFFVWSFFSKNKSHYNAVFFNVLSLISGIFIQGIRGDFPWLGVNILGIIFCAFYFWNDHVNSAPPEVSKSL